MPPSPVSAAAVAPPVPRAPAPPDHARRRGLALAVARQAVGEADCLVTCNNHDIFYLTGVREGISWLAVWDGGAFALSRHMLVDEVRELLPDCEVLLPCRRSTDTPDLKGFLTAQLASRRLQAIVCDPTRMPARAHLTLVDRAAANACRIILLDDAIGGLRAVKDPWETGLIRRCVEIAEEAFRGLIAGGARALLGRSERDVADELDNRMRQLGADRQGFPTTGIIVASGPNSTHAHHTPGARRIAAGEPLLIDWGAELDGYRNDMTRTLFIGAVPEFARRAYPVVEAALHAAAGLLDHGAAMGDIDRAARERVVGSGFTEFHYGVGHGVGLEIHESPRIRAASTLPLIAGMVTTIEPGIYLRGQGGIRIENLYAIRDCGAVSLGGLPTSIESMTLA